MAREFAGLTTHTLFGAPRAVRVPAATEYAACSLNVPI